ncbi:hypothetical protein GCM10010409_34170 [Mycolicibacterium diernhoferi]
MAKRRNIKRDKRGRFASTASRSTRVKRTLPTKLVAGSARRNVKAGRVGPGGAYAGIKAGVELKPRNGNARYWVGVSAGRRIAR